MKHFPFILLLLLGVEVNAQTTYQPTQFEIGLWSPPSLAVDVTPVPADYNGDHKVDMAIRINSGTHCGEWKIEYSDALKTNFFTTDLWDITILPDGSHWKTNEVPVPADYNNDGNADVSVKTYAGEWKIDYNLDGFWDDIFYGCGDEQSHPVPGYYDADTLLDLSVKLDDGRWMIDYAFNGFKGWEDIFTGWGGAESIPLPADYDGDGITDKC